MFLHSDLPHMSVYSWNIFIASSQSGILEKILKHTCRYILYYYVKFTLYMHIFFLLHVYWFVNSCSNWFNLNTLYCSFKTIGLGTIQKDMHCIILPWLSLIVFQKTCNLLKPYMYQKAML